MSKLDPNDRPADDPHEQPTRRVSWRLPLLLAIVLVAIVAVRWTRERASDAPRPVVSSPSLPAVDGETVSLQVEFADGRHREFDDIGWHPGMTVEHLMAAANHLPDGIQYTVRGTGEMMMLTSIDGIENASSGGRYWLYRVNGKLADRSLAVYALEPGDRILWSFSEPE